MKNILLSAIFILLMFGCVNQYQSENNPITPPTISTPTPSTPVYGSLPANYTINFGDYVLADYTLFVDGKIMDTSNATLAVESGIYDPKRSYNPIQFEVALNKGIVNGFVLNVIGMTINETLAFSVQPNLGYGLYDPTKVITIERYYTQELYEVAPRSYFEARGINLSNGTLLSENPMAIVSDMNDENITIFYVFITGQEFIQNEITKKVINITNTTASIELMLQNGTTYSMPNPNTGVPISLRVIDINDSHITLDANHPLANKTLNFKVTILKIKHGNFISD
ncbi:MAG: FKBP-type peptidyl-prolyl cis-trans isomerase [Candidatus Micrarchaeota archaeon]